MFEELVVLPDGELSLRVSNDLAVALSLKKGRNTLVEYRDGVRVMHGRARPYAFKSVEKLRYDFERDVEDALHQG